MRKLLNTLHVMTQGAYLHRDGETISVKLGQESRLRIPVHTLEGLVCWGQVSCSPPVLSLCCESGVGISFLTEQGRFLARVQGPVSGNVLLRRQQYRLCDGADGALPTVRMIVTAKIANSRTVLLRGAREASDPQRSETLRNAAKRLQWIGLDASRAAGIDIARGHEGLAGQEYFSAFDAMINGDRDAFAFQGRSRRPPLDRTNALLSFIYALLRHDIESALESVGLDPAIGFLHADRPGRPSLALDLMEELRSPLADRLALTLINRRQVQASGFTVQDSGATLLEEPTRKQIVAAWQVRKQEEIEHPFLGERIPLGLIPYTQALLLARYIRGGLDAYPAFLWR
ncbi:type I-C CRISPR-associated endonuclease Cas1c [Edaphobacter sp. 12200R-103]|jgi:CRISPR-associated protein Cas1|uniref:type I-C CRISPR-associated endonuclease Cas1c n=1 Tax=Edaphobacter sp. 12200R-103 TaxID=2703788 RepID=UPI00138CEBD4|nr:type I-C CRISPR-associated endonuclease Cas1c [Edaphobacter sp. 12200R-103]QHS53195.1 type I-C CRISPR-associated endonuclease Cas1 [Edaphobacter sp. 12200R-103]